MIIPLLMNGIAFVTTPYFIWLLFKQKTFVTDGLSKENES